MPSSSSSLSSWSSSTDDGSNSGNVDDTVDEELSYEWVVSCPIRGKIILKTSAGSIPYNEDVYGDDSSSVEDEDEDEDDDGVEDYDEDKDLRDDNTSTDENEDSPVDDLNNDLSVVQRPWYLHGLDPSVADKFMPSKFTSWSRKRKRSNNDDHDDDNHSIQDGHEIESSDDTLEFPFDSTSEEGKTELLGDGDVIKPIGDGGEIELTCDDFERESSNEYNELLASHELVRPEIIPNYGEYDRVHVVEGFVVPLPEENEWVLADSESEDSDDSDDDEDDDSDDIDEDDDDDDDDSDDIDYIDDVDDIDNEVEYDNEEDGSDDESDNDQSSPPEGTPLVSLLCDASRAKLSNDCLKCTKVLLEQYVTCIATEDDMRDVNGRTKPKTQRPKLGFCGIQCIHCGFRKFRGSVVKFGETFKLEGVEHLLPTKKGNQFGVISTCRGNCPVSVKKLLEENKATAQIGSFKILNELLTKMNPNNQQIDEQKRKRKNEREILLEKRKRTKGYRPIVRIPKKECRHKTYRRKHLKRLLENDRAYSTTPEHVFLFRYGLVLVFVKKVWAFWNIWSHAPASWVFHEVGVQGH